MKGRPLNIFGSKELPVNISLFDYFSNKNIDLQVFNHCYLYPAYVDNTFFFVKDVQSLKNIGHDLMFILHFLV